MKMKSFFSLSMGVLCSLGHAGIASALLHTGWQELYKLTDRLAPTVHGTIFKLGQNTSDGMASALRHHMGATLVRFGLDGTISEEAFLQAVRNLDVLESDVPKKRRVLDFFVSAPEEFDNIEGAVEFYIRLGEFADLVHRYAHPTVAAEIYFPYPATSIYDTEGKLLPFTTFRPIIDIDTRRIAQTISTWDRRSLEHVLQRRLPELGFEYPSLQDLAGLSLEEMAVWVLMIRLSQSGSRKMKRFTAALFETMGSGSSKEFFSEHNRNNLYRLVFREREDLLPLWSGRLKAVSQKRREFPGVSMQNMTAEENFDGTVFHMPDMPVAN